MRRQNTVKVVDAFFTMVCARVEVRLALHTVQPPFLVGGFLCRFLLLFRSGTTFFLNTTNHHHPYIDNTTMLSDTYIDASCPEHFPIFANVC